MKAKTARVGFFRICLSAVLCSWFAWPAQAAEEKKASLDPRVSLIVGEHGSSDFRQKLGAIHSLDKHISLTDAQALWQGIIAPRHNPEFSPQEWAALYNDVLNVLGVLPQPLPDYAPRLMALVAQQKRDGVLRDYALQHLLAFAEDRMEAAARQDLFAQLEPLVLAVQQSSLPGTYLLGIYRLAGEPGYPPASKIAQEARGIAADGEAFVGNRISAMQICAQLQDSEALALSLQLAKDSQLPTALRMASIAAIGQLGNTQHMLFLRKIKYQHSSDFRIPHAVDSALARLQ